MPWFFYDSNGNQLTAERGTQSVADGVQEPLTFY